MLVASARVAIVAIFYVFVSSAFAGAASMSVGELWQLFPDEHVPEEHFDFAIGTENGSLNEWGKKEFWNVTVPELLFVRPDDSVNGNGTSAVVIPGGGYNWLVWEAEGSEVGAWLASLGIAAFVLKYRVPGRPWLDFGEAALIDAQRAMSLVRSKARSLGLDPERVGVVGFSAGGHVAARLSNGQSRAYERVDDVDDVPFRPDWALLAYPAFLSKRSLGVAPADAGKLPVLSEPPLQSHPPCFLVAAWNDSIVPAESTVAYALALRAVGAPEPELEMLPSGEHGFGYCLVGRRPEGLLPGESPREVCSWPRRAGLWLQGIGMTSPPQARSEPWWAGWWGGLFVVMVITAACVFAIVKLCARRRGYDRKAHPWYEVVET
mmetsp:Transcript_118578/g.335427  ORF Transcript_118578/g.335427 Transcript_118578/m.335427 type:complete len:378 (-) Transcript_118578:81-1214(-)